MRTVRLRRSVLVLPQEIVTVLSVTTAMPGEAVTISGRGFGVSGALQYAGIVTETTSWAPETIDLIWPDIPFDADFSALSIGQQYTLTVRTGTGGQGSYLVATEAATADIYRQITALTGIFANDVGVDVGDHYYWRTLSGTVTDVTSAGYPRGTTVGARGKYAVWDGSSWTNTATSIVQL